MLPEQLLWQRLRPFLKRIGAHAVRVENALDPGTPDVNYCLAGHADWLELKVASPAPRRVNPGSIVHVGIRREQLVWWSERAGAGRQIKVLIEAPGWPVRYLLLTSSALLDYRTWASLTQRASWRGDQFDAALGRALREL